MYRARKLEILSAAAFLLSSLMASAPAFAHHSFAAEYDTKKPITLTGTVTKLEWTNPHARFHVSVKDDSGTVAVWDFELGSPNGLMRHGWTRNSLKPGDTVTVMGYLAKDGSKLVSARSVTLPDGHKIFAGSAEDDQ